MSERSKQYHLLTWLLSKSDKCYYCSKTVERYNDIFESFGLNPADGLAELDSFQRRYLFQTMATVDHVIPRSEGGATRRENVVLACFPCNQGRHRKPKRGRIAETHLDGMSGGNYVADF